MNIGSFKKYLKDGNAMVDGPAYARIRGRTGVESEAEDARGKSAKTMLKMTLQQHDKVYHKDGYKDGDVCNFREAMKRGDSADMLAKAEKKEAENLKLGLVRFREDAKTGKKEVVGIEDIVDVASEAAGGVNPPLEDLVNLPSWRACKYGPYGKDDRPCNITCYNKETQWRSMNAAKYCFGKWAEYCDGAEKERYETIRDFLDAGCVNVSDDINNPTKEMEKIIEAVAKEMGMPRESLDEMPSKGLEEHDRRFHPGGYKPGDFCEFRKAMERRDIADLLGAPKPSISATDLTDDVYRDAVAKFVDVHHLRKSGGELTAAMNEVRRFVESADAGQIDLTPPNTGIRSNDMRFASDIIRAVGEDHPVAVVLSSAIAKAGGDNGESDDGVSEWRKIAAPVYAGPGDDVEEFDAARRRLDEFMLAHPEVADADSNAAYDLKNAVDMNPGWHLSNPLGRKKNVFHDDDIEGIATEISAADADVRYEFYRANGEGAFGTNVSSDLYDRALRKAILWSLSDDQEVWSSSESKDDPCFVAKNGKLVSLDAILSDVEGSIVDAAMSVASESDPVATYLKSVRE